MSEIKRHIVMAGSEVNEMVYASDYDKVTAENQELRELLTDKVVDQTKLTGFVARQEGGATVGIQGGAAALLAQSFGQMLYESPAENYIETSFTSPDYPDLGAITVTIKRETGKTPHELRAAAEQERDEADRRAGAAERKLAEEVDSRIRRDGWLRKAKEEAGYHDGTSFDVVWKETLEKAAERDTLRFENKRLEELLRDCVKGWQKGNDVVGPMQRAVVALADMDAARYEPCGSCGATNPSEHCTGCAPVREGKGGRKP